MAVVAPCITVETDDQYKQAIERIMPFAPVSYTHLDVYKRQV